MTWNQRMVEKKDGVKLNIQSYNACWKRRWMVLSFSLWRTHKMFLSPFDGILCVCTLWLIFDEVLKSTREKLKHVSCDITWSGSSYTSRLIFTTLWGEKTTILTDKLRPELPNWEAEYFSILSFEETFIERYRRRFASGVLGVQVHVNSSFLFATWSQHRCGLILSLPRDWW